MCCLFLFGNRLRMNRHGGFLLHEGPHQEAYSKKDERYGQKLSHIERHVLLESHLGVLYKLDQEAAAEASDEEYSHEGSPINLGKFPLVKGKEDKAKEKICSRLIQLGGVAGNGFSVALEDEAPGKVCGVAVDFAVEQVAKADETGGEGDWNHKMVHEPHDVEVVLGAVFPCVPDEAKDDGDGASVACQAALPWHEYLPEALPGAKVIVRLVEDAMPKTCTHDGADKEHVQHGIQQGRIYLFLKEEMLHYEPSQNEPAHEQQRVPPEFKPSYMQDGRVDIPMYYQIFHDAKIVKNGKNQRRFAVNAQTIRVKTTDSIAAPNQNHDTTEKSYTAASAAAPAVLPDSMVNPLTKS